MTPSKSPGRKSAAVFPSFLRFVSFLLVVWCGWWMGGWVGGGCCLLACLLAVVLFFLFCCFQTMLTHTKTKLTQSEHKQKAKDTQKQKPAKNS